MINNESIGPGVYADNQNTRKFYSNSAAGFNTSQKRALDRIKPYSKMTIMEKFNNAPGPCNYENESKYSISGGQLSIKKKIGLKKSTAVKSSTGIRGPSVGPGHYEINRDLGKNYSDRMQSNMKGEKNRIKIIRPLNEEEIMNRDHPLDANNKNIVKERDAIISAFNKNHRKCKGIKFSKLDRFPLEDDTIKNDFPGPGEYEIDSPRNFTKESPFFLSNIDRNLELQKPKVTIETLIKDISAPKQEELATKPEILK